MPLKLLIIGGTSEASRIAERLAGDPLFATTLSLAGRTAVPRLPPVPTRVGGFGGADGLAAHLRAEAIDVLIDATHPFAVRISANAQSAAMTAGVVLLVLDRPPWQAVAGDRWTSVGNLAAAAAALPDVPSRVFLTVGRQSLGPFAAKPQHHYVIRVIDPPEIPAAMADVEVLQARGPFQIDGETALMRRHRIAWLVTKNSGGEAAYAKIAAARELQLPVALVEQPKWRGAGALTSVDAVLAELARLHDVLVKRSV